MERTEIIDLTIDSRIPNLKHFACVDPRVDIAPLLDELSRNEDAWYVNTKRQDSIAVQRETESISLRKRVPSNSPLINPNHIQDTFEDRAMTARFPLLHRFVNDFARQKRAEPGLVTLARLKPGKKVYPHTDWGQYYDVRDRYHLVLASPAGSILTSGGETVRMHEGELWWFDNHAVHESFNEGGEWRVHLIFDLLPNRRRYRSAWIKMRQQLSVIFHDAPPASDSSIRQNE